MFDGESGHIKSIANIISGVSSNINQQFYWYNASTGNDISEEVMDNSVNIAVTILL